MTNSENKRSIEDIGSQEAIENAKLEKLAEETSEGWDRLVAKTSALKKSVPVDSGETVSGEETVGESLDSLEKETAKPLITYYDVLDINPKIVDAKNFKKSVRDAYNAGYDYVKQMQESGEFDDEEAAGLIEQISVAKETLLDDEKRKEYDASLASPALEQAPAPEVNQEGEILEAKKVLDEAFEQPKVEESKPEIVSNVEKKEEEKKIQEPGKKNLAEELRKLENDVEAKNEFLRKLSGLRVYHFVGEGDDRKKEYLALKPGSAIKKNGEAVFVVYNDDGTEKGEITHNVKKVNYREWKEATPTKEEKVVMFRDEKGNFSERQVNVDVDEFALSDFEFTSEKEKKFGYYLDADEVVKYENAYAKKTPPRPIPSKKSPEVDSVDVGPVPDVEQEMIIDAELINQTTETKEFKIENKGVKMGELKKEYFEAISNCILFCNESIEKFEKEGNKEARDYFANTLLEVNSYFASAKEKIDARGPRKLEKDIQTLREKFGQYKREAQEFTEEFENKRTKAEKEENLEESEGEDKKEETKTSGKGWAWKLGRFLGQTTADPFKEVTESLSELKRVGDNYVLFPEPAEPPKNAFIKWTRAIVRPARALLSFVSGTSVVVYKSIVGRENMDEVVEKELSKGESPRTQTPELKEEKREKSKLKYKLELSPDGSYRLTGHDNKNIENLNDVYEDVLNRKTTKDEEKAKESVLEYLRTKIEKLKEKDKPIPLAPDPKEPAPIVIAPLENKSEVEQIPVVNVDPLSAQEPEVKVLQSTPKPKEDGNELKEDSVNVVEEIYDFLNIPRENFTKEQITEQILYLREKYSKKNKGNLSAEDLPKFDKVNGFIDHMRDLAGGKTTVDAIYDILKEKASELTLDDENSVAPSEPKRKIRVPRAPKTK